MKGARVACTLVTPDYLPAGLSVAKSFLKHNPGCHFIVFYLGEELPRRALPQGVQLVSSQAFLAGEDSDLQQYYSRFEWINAMRPRAIAYLLGHCKVRKAIYLDADIWVTGGFGMVWRALDKSSFAYTPHITQPYPLDGNRPTELALMQYGTFNSGFMAFRQDKTAMAALEFWKSRLDRFGFFDPPHLHGGQRLLDLMAVIFRKGFCLLDSPALNTAYWNLHERKITRRSGCYYVNGRRAVFFHLSGHDFSQPERFTRVRGRHGFESHPLLRRIYGEYQDALRGFNGGKLIQALARFEGAEEDLERRRYFFVHRKWDGYTSQQARELRDPTVFSELLLSGACGEAEL